MRLRLPAFILFVIVALVLCTFAIAAVHAADPPCGQKECECGCKDDGGDCNRCATASTAGLTWEVARGDADQVILWRFANRYWSQVGNYRISSDEYRPLLPGDRWGDPCNPPLAVPECHRRHRHPRENFGVDWKPKAEGRERWTVNGVEVPRDEAMKAVQGAGPMPDDGKLPWVVWVGDEATGQKVAADVPADKARFQSYRPGEAMVMDRGGNPTLYTPGLWFVTAGGVARHEKSYTGTPQVIEGIRQASQGWNPDSVPPLDSPNVLPNLPISDQAKGAAALAGGGLFVVAFSAVAKALKGRTATP